MSFKDKGCLCLCLHQLITAQAKQQETLVHIVSVLNITR